MKTETRFANMFKTSNLAAFAAASLLFATPALAANREFQESVDDGQGHYLATESGNWTSGDNHFFLNPYTVTFNTADLSFSDAIRIRSASGAFGDVADILSDSNDKWLVWQSIDGSTDYGLTLSGSGNKVRLSDESGNVARLKIASGTYTVTGGSLDVAARTASAYILQTGGLLKVPDGAMVLGCTYWNGDGGNGYYTLQGGAATLKQAVLNNAQNGKGVLKVAGGDLTITDYLRIAEGSSTAGEFVQTTGHTSVGSYLCVGSQSSGSKDGYNALFQLDGGTVTNTGTAMIIGARGNGTAQAKAVVNGGELVANQIWVAEYSSGSNELEINNGLVVVSGDFYIAKQSGSNGKLTLNGGTLQTTGIKTAATAAIDFNGGTITDAGSGSHTLVTAATTAKVLSGGAKFAIPGGAEAKILAALATGVTEGTDGGLTKTGAGSLTLASGNTFTGPVTVKEGTLIYSNSMYDSSVTGGKIVLDGGRIAVAAASDGTLSLGTPVEVKSGMLVIDPSALTTTPTAGSTLTVTGLSFASGTSSADTVFVSGVNLDWTAAYNGDGSITFTAAEPSGDNKWLGGASGDWDMAANWKYGVPTSSQTVVFDTDAVVSLSTSGTSHYYVSNIVANATIQFKSTNTSSVHPSINFKEATGDGTIQLYHAGLIVSALPGTISEKTTIEILYVSATSDSWLEGNSAAVPLKVYGSITGAGYLINRKQTYFYGDNSGHTGAVLCEHTIGVSDAKHFGPGNTGFPNSSSLEIQSGIYLEGNADDVYNFGGLKMATFNANNYDFHIYVPTGFTGTMKVGCGNQDVEILNKHKTAFRVDGQNDYNGIASAVLEKVGTGTLTTRILGAYKLKVTEGTAVIGADNSSLAVEVASGAVLMGGTTIASVSFESGAIIRQAIAASGETYTCPTLTINGTVDVTGVVGDLVDADNFLANAEATDEDLPVFTLLSATSVTGKPTGAIDMATDGWAWMAKVRNAAQLVMRASSTNPGLIIIFK